jgi:hypothetical protein
VTVPLRRRADGRAAAAVAQDQRRLRRLAVMLLAVVLLAACSDADDEAVASIPTQPFPVGEDRPGRDALLVGTLRGDANQGCLWLEPAGVSEGLAERVSVVWPHGYAARFDPVPQLLDEEGRVVAEEGDVLEAGGGTTDSIDSCEVSTELWSINSVEGRGR